MLLLTKHSVCTLRLAKAGGALSVSKWWWVRLDAILLHEGSELVGDLSQRLSSLGDTIIHVVYCTSIMVIYACE